MKLTRSVGNGMKAAYFLAACALCLGSLAAPSGAAVPTSDTKVKIKASSYRTKTPGQQVITLKLNIDKNWYIYANPVGLGSFESNATKVTVKSGGRAIPARVIYPKGKSKDLAGLKYNAYEGTTTIHVVVQRPATARVLQVDVQVNACGTLTTPKGPRDVCLKKGVKTIVIP